MSFSNLLELESCPKRWALSKAQYQQIWAASGYPQLPNLAALRGTIVHRIIRLIAERFLLLYRAGNSKPRVSQVLKNLGGYTPLIGNIIEAVLRQYHDNPRALSFLKKVHTQLLADIPDLRLKSQELLSRVNFDRNEYFTSCDETVRSERTRSPLPDGIYSELELRSTDLGWHGFVDLFTLSPDYCEIRDFKAGKEKEEHIFQLHMYALLWLEDHDLNPQRRPVTRLLVSYLNKDVEIPLLTQSDYLRIENSIKERTIRALMSIESMPPTANVKDDNCKFCSVRQLCNEYWDAQQKRAPKLIIDDDSPFIDIQAIIVSRRGPSSWDAKIESSYFAFNEKPLLIYDPNTSLSILKEDVRVRFLNVYAYTGETEEDSITQPLRVSFGNQSEFFIIPQS